MKSNKGTARVVGVLFLLATAAFMAGSGLIDSVLNQPTFLTDLYPDRMKVIAGLFLELINSAAVVGIAILMFPILKPYNESIALGYFGSRIIEAALLIVSIISPLILLALSDQYIAEGAVGDSSFLTIGNLAVRGQEMAFELAMLVLSLGSVMFCSLLYQTKLVPRALSLLGIIGYIALLASSCLSIIGLDPGFILFIPGAIFEIIFPIWLIAKGFMTK
ncbi:DUF4386 domain-containing protein [Paenibacillus sp. PL91]|uniref:DUF4386 domain-containing protein n=1 Tax=Paenibacillus sp. PL91 TaxID=2729538 RepID=UPI00145F5A8A|nr:DUF4386 domain-containing protein [Paenibacillus sp. PL91]MBC9201094.1 DUF4386 domain-containing protein [Paenibacillus sp. PL91]